MAEAVIVDSVRTGLAKSFRGGFNQTRADNMTAYIVDALMDRNPEVDPSTVEDMILGCGAPEGAQGHNIARNVAVLSKLPIEVGGTTVNRYCSSGLQTIAMAATQVQSGFADCIIAGGVESISTTQGKGNMHMYVNEKLAEEAPGIYHAMGTTAETVAKRYGVSRESQDEYALSSQERCAKGQDQGLFDDEIIPMETKMLLVNKETGAEKEVDAVVDKDNCNRPETTLEGLASLNPVFDPEEGSVTAGNSSQLSDGASVTMVMSEEKANELGVKPLAYFRGFTVVGCQPDEMGIGPLYSIPKLLKSANLTVDDIDLWELNEAFASQVVYIRDQLGLSTEKLNVNGGSIAIGHPFGMTGSRQVGHLTRELRRRGGKYGIVTMCVGGGMGATGLFESIPE
ncbi:MAG TPA: thiolase family protein [Gammaproteobacteria bacterium]|jgi:acetyl-CoA acyltransferase|nr:thiolase family protein [Gammaproteobacteria bacterium]HIA43401.1 thiolase family protein [Gammaproteobacteria bacterium]HIA95822.1 thiolase family protein [Gammaproteobacteria bacterium]HIB75716.1 thiolase family protein [Gammaproteobacteria bacterium]HIG49645.1 thiolase family protein [Gammaproteobacteria bacterium]|tara:strand:+ start:55 stop:1248 length:1194 start_codon:yes stop_codon:yes gene_type:complete